MSMGTARRHTPRALRALPDPVGRTVYSRARSQGREHRAPREDFVCPSPLPARPPQPAAQSSAARTLGPCRASEAAADDPPRALCTPRSSTPTSPVGSGSWRSSPPDSLWAKSCPPPNGQRPAAPAALAGEAVGWGVVRGRGLGVAWPSAAVHTENEDRTERGRRRGCRDRMLTCNPPSARLRDGAGGHKAER